MYKQTLHPRKRASRWNHLNFYYSGEAKLLYLKSLKKTAKISFCWFLAFLFRAFLSVSKQFCLFFILAGWNQIENSPQRQNWVPDHKLWFWLNHQCEMVKFRHFFCNLQLARHYQHEHQPCVVLQQQCDATVWWKESKWHASMMALGY